MHLSPPQSWIGLLRGAGEAGLAPSQGGLSEGQHLVSSTGQDCEGEGTGAP